MKKIVVMALMGLLGTGAFAQTSQGTVALEGTVGISKTNFKSENVNTNRKIIYTNWSIAPSVGYFIQDDTEIGLSLGGSSSTSKYKNEDEKTVESSRYNSISFSPYARKYVAITQQLQLHGTGYVLLGFVTYKDKTNIDSSLETTANTTAYGIGLYPGVTYFATPKLGFTANFGTVSYTKSKDKPKDDKFYTSTNNSFTANLSPSSLTIGLSYYIAR